MACMIQMFLKVASSPESELLLVIRLNDNLTPGPGRLVLSSHQRSELSNSILGIDSRVWKCIPIPNGLGEKATLVNICISNGDLK